MARKSKKKGVGVKLPKIKKWKKCGKTK